MDSARILIVEDETIIALEIKGQLESLDYSIVAIVSTGEKAIEQAASQRPDLVLMDMKIKGKMDGIEAAGIIHTRHNIPVIFLTAYLDDDRLQRAKLAMPYGYLLKPVQERELKVTIEMALHTAQVDRKQRNTKRILDQRVKELECFYGISRLAETPGISLDQLLEEVIELIAQAWQYPEVTHSRIEFNDGNTLFCKHGNLAIVEEWSQAVRIKVHNKHVGTLKVFYTEERPQADEKVFLKEERFLLNSLGERIGTLIERFEMQQALQETEKKLYSALTSRPKQSQTQQEEEYRVLFELESDFLALIENDTGNILEVNKSFLKQYGYDKDEVTTLNKTDLLAAPEATETATEYHGTAGVLHWHKRKDGSLFPVEVVSSYFEYKGKAVHMESIREVSDWVKAEQPSNASSEENDKLLQKIHHRVKNNLALIVGLINLQSTKTGEEVAKDGFRDSQNRLDAMSLIHTYLHQSDNPVEINVKNYLADLVLVISKSFGQSAGQIETSLNLEDHTISVDLASPIGLIVNELVTNSFKHAFPDAGNGKINISFNKNREQTLELRIVDNGIGMPNEPDWETFESSGLSLTKSLVQNQLNGTISIASRDGTTCTVTIPTAHTH